MVGVGGGGGEGVGEVGDGLLEYGVVLLGTRGQHVTGMSRDRGCHGNR